MAEHWGLDDPVECLTPTIELEDIELGDRVGWFLTTWYGVSLYGDAGGRANAATLELVGEVATAARAADRPFPVEWWPADAGPYPCDLQTAR